ncbi:2-oxoglutarate oxidoreductase, partial [Clostridium perfringens]|nr:2-oxoglutarate oxidoreductase [Clostridium perfringens]
PIRVSEMIATLDGACYVERVSVDNIPNLTKAKKAIKKAFNNSIQGLGYSFIEVLSTCPTNWGLSPVDSLKWLRENMIPYYSLGVKKDCKKEDK